LWETRSFSRPADDEDVGDDGSGDVVDDNNNDGDGNNAGGGFSWCIVGYCIVYRY